MITAFGPGVVLAIEHPQYAEQTEVSPATVSELLSDLRTHSARTIVTRS